jgi:hypothetical protein
MKLSNLKANPDNPRVIRDHKFEKLCNSIKEFQKMMELRPIVVDKDDMVLGGNMRLEALKVLGYKEIPDSWVKKASDLTEEEKQQFIIKDNVGFGEWDWETLANKWEEEKLSEWGLDAPVWATEDIDVDSFFEEANDDEKEKPELNKITLEYNDEDFEKITELFSTTQGSKEKIVYEALFSNAT